VGGFGGLIIEMSIIPWRRSSLHGRFLATVVRPQKLPSEGGISRGTYSLSRIMVASMKPFPVTRKLQLTFITTSGR
jgi:hypothetical protein